MVESVPIPAGHVAILTSPYAPQWCVNGRFSGPDGVVHRGPVTFQLEIGESGTKTPQAADSAKVADPAKAAG